MKMQGIVLIIMAAVCSMLPALTASVTARVARIAPRPARDPEVEWRLPPERISSSCESEIAKARQRIRLGFDSWAAYQLDAKMARTPERALALLHEVDARLLPKARAEIAALGITGRRPPP